MFSVLYYYTGDIMKNRQFYKDDLEAAVKKYNNDIELIRKINAKNKNNCIKEHSFYGWLDDQYRDPSKEYINVKLGANDDYIWIDKSIIVNKKIYPINIKKSLQVLRDNGIEEDECETVLQAIGYTLLDIELFDGL